MGDLHVRPDGSETPMVRVPIVAFASVVGGLDASRYLLDSDPLPKKQKCPLPRIYAQLSNCPDQDLTDGCQ